ncbi:MAG: carbon starvation protein A [Phycisphaerae bacterium]
MNPFWAAIACFVLYVAGYRYYAKHLSTHVYRLDPQRLTPAHTLRDEIDYVATNRLILFGHHYASITGLAPMLGPAVAVIWGWVPATLWVVLGAVFVGCVHDFSALVVSMRAQGQSIGKVAESVIGGRAKLLFLALIFFGIALAMGVFVFIIAKLLQAGPDFDPHNLSKAATSFPSAVLPSATLMILAVIMGHLLYKRKAPLAPTTLAGFVLMLIAVWLGTRFPTLGVDPGRWPGQTCWTWILLAYSFLASVLPVWSLLQARDFLNSLLLYLGLLTTYAGFFVLRPTFAAPALRLHPEGAPSLFPFVFIVIACGAASGFHALVSSGTTAKQINTETDARPIGYGGMIGESLLGLIAVLACTAGFESAGAWQSAYRDWATIQAELASKLGAFIHGSSRFIEALGISRDLAAAFIAVVVVSFALTTLDSATRLLRFNVSEMGASLRIRVLANRFLATAIAVGAICFFAFYRLEDVETGQLKPAGLALWTLFGTTNQLLAGLALLVATLYLHQRGRNPWFTGLPTLFMLISTFTALFENLATFIRKGQYLLLVVGSALLLVGVGIVIEGILVLRRRPRYTDDVIVFPVG